VREASAEVQTVELAVTDTGVGVSPEQQRALFADYAQAAASTAQRHGGTGLGLAICRRLAELMGGDVAMESAPGRGTVVRLVVPLPVADPGDVDPLPVAPGDVAAAIRRKPTREEARREGSLLLIAEDHVVNRTVLRHQLDIIGFEMDFAQDGSQALERYLEERYALVLTDLNMPGMDGYDLARAIRRHEASTGGERVPIVALSANVMQGEPERCREAGMDDFAAKPTTIAFLSAKLRYWLPHLDWTHETESVAHGLDSPLEPLFDQAVLAEVTGGDADLAMELIGDFLDSTQGDIEALDDALAGNALDEARRRAHRIKGAARTVGAHAVVALAQQIEALAASGGSPGELASLAARLHDAFGQCQAALASRR
jgi:CheY-like chemotaxis protein